LLSVCLFVRPAGHPSVGQAQHAGLTCVWPCLWQVIAKAKVPIIKFVEVASGLSFDLSFDVANGPQAAVVVRDLIQRLPPMKPLIFVLKVFLQQRDLNEVCLAFRASWGRCSGMPDLYLPTSPGHG
jgi:hypothetical protein